MAVNLTQPSEPAASSGGALDLPIELLAGVAEATAHLPTAEERFDALRPFYAAVVSVGLLRCAVASLGEPDGRGIVASALAELMAVDVNVPLMVLASALAAAPVVVAGTPEQRDRLLAPLLVDAGAPLAAVAIGSREATDDLGVAPSATATTLRSDGDDWSLSGWRQEVTNGYGWHGQGAAFYTVACRVVSPGFADDSLAVVVVPGDAPGLHITGSREPTGAPAVISPRIHFDGVNVPAHNVVGELGVGREIITDAWTQTATVVGAASHSNPITRLFGGIGSSSGLSLSPHNEEMQRVHEGT